MSMNCFDLRMRVAHFYIDFARIILMILLDNLPEMANIIHKLVLINQVIEISTAVLEISWISS